MKNQEQELATAFVSLGWALSHALGAEHGLCDDHSCYRCCLSRLLYDTEVQFKLVNVEAFKGNIEYVNARLATPSSDGVN